MAHVWGYDADESDDVVRVFVSRLRRKIESDPANPEIIVNVPGVGPDKHASWTRKMRQPVEVITTSTEVRTALRCDGRRRTRVTARQPR